MAAPAANVGGVPPRPDAETLDATAVDAVGGLPVIYIVGGLPAAVAAAVVDDLEAVAGIESPVARLRAWDISFHRAKETLALLLPALPSTIDDAAAALVAAATAAGATIMRTQRVTWAAVDALVLARGHSGSPPSRLSQSVRRCLGHAVACILVDHASRPAADVADAAQKPLSVRDMADGLAKYRGRLAGIQGNGAAGSGEPGKEVGEQAASGATAGEADPPRARKRKRLVEDGATARRLRALGAAEDEGTQGATAVAAARGGAQDEGERASGGSMAAARAGEANSTAAAGARGVEQSERVRKRPVSADSARRTRPRVGRRAAKTCGADGQSATGELKPGAHGGAGGAGVQNATGGGRAEEGGGETESWKRSLY